MRELEGLVVKVGDVVPMVGLETPAGKPHSFVYSVFIRNGSREMVILRGRKWVVRERGETVVVEGEGVAGGTPELAPGEIFSYSSYHTVGSVASAEGTLFGLTAAGEAVLARIPRFEMRAPSRP